ncbi:M4 family metallopeptidase [Pseudoduganella danionis]|nr:M4 family metallopeptidase [Pseudoduganella danionis]
MKPAPLSALWPLLATMAGYCTAAHAAPQLMAPPVTTLSPQQSSNLLTQLTAMDAARGLAPELSVRLSSQHPGAAGQKIVRTQHTYKGLRIFGSESVVVTDTAGTIVSVASTDRRAVSTGGLAPLAAADVPPAISPAEAIRIAASSVAPRGVDRWPPSAELLIFPIARSVRVPAAQSKQETELNAADVQEVIDRYALAYYVKTRMAQDNKPVYYDTIIDANTGAILAQWPALKTVVGSGNSQYNGVVPINTSVATSGFQMLDTTRGSGGKYGGMAITNANHSSADNPDPGNIYTNSSNSWGDGKQYVNGGSTTSANGQTAAVNALWGLMNTYDANRNALGWHSLDGNNTATYIAAHVDTSYDNAFYDDGCKCMYIGDGNHFNSLGAIDVIGHEMSHGVTAATADLVYAGESGGLNESNSDVGGEMVEAYARAGGTGGVIPASGNDWMMGTEISKNGQPLRWMYRPSKDGSSPDAWSSSLKYLDVHYSSGPNNRMFYFLAQGSKADPTSDYYSKYLTRTPAAMHGIGSDKAYRIWFKALTTKFTSTTGYADARAKVLEAAQELYGASSKEAIAVQRAYAAINVGDDIDEADGGGGEPQGTERIINGGFEDGINGWKGATAVIGSDPAQVAYEGTRYARMGGKGHTTNQVLTQSVNIPASATQATLSFATHIETGEVHPVAYDQLTVTLKDGAGKVVRTLARYSNKDAVAGYQLHSFDVLAQKGKTLTLSFAMHEDNSKPTFFVIDKVSLLTN